MYYMFNLFGQYVGISETECERSTSDAPPELISSYNWNGYNWVYAPHVKPVEIDSTLGLGVPSPNTQDTVADNETESAVSE